MVKCPKDPIENFIKKNGGKVLSIEFIYLFIFKKESNGPLSEDKSPIVRPGCYPKELVPQYDREGTCRGVSSFAPTGMSSNSTRSHFRCVCLVLTGSCVNGRIT